MSLTGWIIIAVLIYAVVGVIIFNTPALITKTKQTNPVQNKIRWIPNFVLAITWPIALIVWILSGCFSRVAYPNYVSHQAKMEKMIREKIITPAKQKHQDIEIDSTDIPSPSEFDHYALENVWCNIKYARPKV